MPQEEGGRVAILDGLRGRPQDAGIDGIQTAQAEDELRQGRAALMQGVEHEQAEGEAGGMIRQHHAGGLFVVQAEGQQGREAVQEQEGQAQQEPEPGPQAHAGKQGAHGRGAVPCGVRGRAHARSWGAASSRVTSVAST